MPNVAHTAITAKEMEKQPLREWMTMNSLDKWSVIFAAVAFLYCVLSLGLFAPSLIVEYVNTSGDCIAIIGTS
jgi:hypothetical protein